MSVKNQWTGIDVKGGESTFAELIDTLKSTVQSFCEN